MTIPNFLVWQKTTWLYLVGREIVVQFKLG